MGNYFFCGNKMGVLRFLLFSCLISCSSCCGLVYVYELVGGFGMVFYECFVDVFDLDVFGDCYMVF